MPVFLYHYAAIIFYLVKMFKSKDIPYPRAIVFSGNGSRYIDNLLISEKERLQEVTMIILKGEYKDVKPIQLILPENRKESTCYGGLYRKKDASIPESYVFMGVDGELYEDVKSIQNAFENNLRQNLIKEIKLFHEYYCAMLNKLKKASDIKTEGIEDLLSKELEDILETNFKKQVLDKYDLDTSFDDTLFFLPIVNKILELTSKKWSK